ncbi:MAG: anti-sigma factor [Lysobacteraceae bacterium]|nr:MAG: anti-sigma factor [Xanthomonadaceae bacterium]
MTTDKIDNHYFQQLSALMDGDLPPDQARFLLRRMGHDSDLTGCWERWQLCGDVLRGRAEAPAPAGFAERIAQAIVVQPGPPAANARDGHKGRTLARWGGGALAASLAVVALFMVRQQVPDPAPDAAAPALATRTVERPVPVTSANATAAIGADPVVVASVPRRQNSDLRRSATRSQQAARNAAAARARQDRALAVAVASPAAYPLASVQQPAASASADPFSTAHLAAPAARPWPRSVMPQYSTGSGAFNAGYSTDSAKRTFYPFDPRLPESPPVNPPAGTARE